MQEEHDKSRIKTIYWTITIVPFLLLNLSPYMGINFSLNADGTNHGQLRFLFSLAFVLFLVGTFTSFKCLQLSEQVFTKVGASLCFILYLLIVLLMTYFYMTGAISDMSTPALTS